MKAELTDEAPQPAIALARKRLAYDRAGNVRPATISSRFLSREERDAQRLLGPIREKRPRTRGDCVDGPRPCPYVGCRHHLYLDVDPVIGTIKLNFPHLELDEMRETCALDVADRHGNTLDDVGKLVNITRERIRQMEEKSLRRLRRTELEPLGCDSPWHHDTNSAVEKA